MANVNFQFFSYLVIIVLGYICKRLKLVKEEDGDALARLIINVTLPALILDTLPHIKIDLTLSLMPLVAILSSLPFYAITYLLFRKEEKTLRGNLLMLVMGWNIGLFAYPLVEGIWGMDGLKYIAMFDVGNAVVIFILCYIIAVRHSPTETHFDAGYIVKKLVTLAPLLSYGVGLAMNLLGWQFPPLVANVFSVLGKANGAIVFLTLGIFLNFSFAGKSWQHFAKIFTVRYGIGLLVGLLVYALFPHTTLFGLIALTGLVAPIGMAILSYTVQYGYDRRMTGAMINLSILVSFGLTWVLILLLVG